MISKTGYRPNGSSAVTDAPSLSLSRAEEGPALARPIELRLEPSRYHKGNEQAAKLDGDKAAWAG